MIEQGLDQTVTADFRTWQAVLEILSGFAIHAETRQSSKDSMVCIHQIIITCRENRKYQRDTIPDETVIKVRFGSEIWLMAEVIEKWKKWEEEAIPV